MCSYLRSLAAFARYSASQVFAGKFAYFLVLAVLVFFTVAIIHTANEKVPPNPAVIYYFLLVAGVVLVFYPAAYAVQGDVDARMLETLFGIPDYRYKVWLARQLVQQLVIAALLLLLATFCHLALADFSIGAMAQTCADTHRIEMISHGLCDPSDVSGTTEKMIRFLAAGLRAPISAPVEGDVS